MTLIGAFITATGIFLAADSATSDPASGRGIGTAVKVAVTGRQSGAAINGNLQWKGDVEADFHKTFVRISADLAKRGAVPLEEQVEIFAHTLKLEAESRAVPAMRRRLLEVDGGVLLTVTLAGIETNPLILAVRLRLAPSADENSPVRFDVLRTPALGCWWLAGHDEVAGALLRDFPNRPSPPPPVLALRERPEVRVIAGQGPNAPCAGASAKIVSDFFRLAVEATIEHGVQFGIPKAAVGGPIRALKIEKGSVTLVTLQVRR